MPEFTETSMGKLVDMKIKLIASRSRWTSCRPYAIFLVTVPKIDEDRLIFTDSFSVKFEKIIRPFNPDTKGPFLAILTFAEPKGKVGSGWFEAINCAAVPILDDHTLFAVDNEHERKVADSLRWYFHRSDAKVENVVIRKPLHGIYNEMEGLQIRPDFVIQKKLASAVLEVIGRDDYMDRKARTIPLMENLYGKVWEYDSEKFKQNPKEIIRIMKEIKLHLEAKQGEISRF
jgi:hypothetical protein